MHNTTKLVVVQSPSRVRLFTTPWGAEPQASLFLTISRSLPKFMSVESKATVIQTVLLAQKQTYESME